MDIIHSTERDAENVENITILKERFQIIKIAENVKDWFCKFQPNNDHFVLKLKKKDGNLTKILHWSGVKTCPFLQTS